MRGAVFVRRQLAARTRWLTAAVVALGVGWIGHAGPASADAQSEADMVVVVDFVEQVINGHDLSVAEQLLTPDFTQHMSPPIAPGRDGFMKHYQKLFKRIAEYQIDIDHVLASDGLAAVHGRLHGVTKGGNKIDFRVIDIYRLDGGKIAERWHVRQLTDP